MLSFFKQLQKFSFFSCSARQIVPRKRHNWFLPVEHQGTLVEGENQRRRDRLGKEFRMPQQSQPLGDPFDPHTLGHRSHLQRIVHVLSNVANINFFFRILESLIQYFNALHTRQVILKDAPILLNLPEPLPPLAIL